MFLTCFISLKWFSLIMSYILKNKYFIWFWNPITKQHVKLNFRFKTNAKIILFVLFWDTGCQKLTRLIYLIYIFNISANLLKLNKRTLIDRFLTVMHNIPLKKNHLVCLCFMVRKTNVYFVIDHHFLSKKKQLVLTQNVTRKIIAWIGISVDKSTKTYLGKFLIMVKMALSKSCLFGSLLIIGISAVNGEEGRRCS